MGVGAILAGSGCISTANFGVEDVRFGTRVAGTGVLHVLVGKDLAIVRLLCCAALAAKLKEKKLKFVALREKGCSTDPGLHTVRERPRNATLTGGFAPG